RYRSHVTWIDFAFRIMVQHQFRLARRLQGRFKVAKLRLSKSQRRIGEIDIGSSSNCLSKGKARIPIIPFVTTHYSQSIPTPGLFAWGGILDHLIQDRACIIKAWLW